MRDHLFVPIKSLTAVALALLTAVALHAAEAQQRSTGGAKWRDARKAEDFRELEILVDSGEARRVARAELGDAGLFERLALLLKKNFTRYDQKTVDAALRCMKQLLPAVDPVRAATDLTHIRSRVELVTDKVPQWRSTLGALDAMLDKLKQEYK